MLSPVPTVRSVKAAAELDVIESRRLLLSWVFALPVGSDVIRGHGSQVSKHNLERDRNRYGWGWVAGQ